MHNNAIRRRVSHAPPMAYLAISLRSGPMALIPASPNPRAHAAPCESTANSFCSASSATIIGTFAARAFFSYESKHDAAPTSPPFSVVASMTS